MTDTYKWRVIVYKEVAATELGDYSVMSNDYYKAKKMFPNNKIMWERVKDDKKEDV